MRAIQSLAPIPANTILLSLGWGPQSCVLIHAGHLRLAANTHLTLFNTCMSQCTEISAGIVNHHTATDLPCAAYKPFHESRSRRVTHLTRCGGLHFSHRKAKSGNGKVHIDLGPPAEPCILSSSQLSFKYTLACIFRAFEPHSTFRSRIHSLLLPQCIS